MSMSILSVNDWNNSGKVVPCNYTCGYCGQKVGSSDGYKLREHDDMIAIYLCPFCGRPSFMENGNLTPGSPYGQSIDDLPETVQSIYDEARNSFRAGAYTGVILICRKVLANVAIYYGADDGDSFVHYVDYLVNKGYVPLKSRDWVDKIRVEGNQATHNQTAKNKDDAKRILDFVQMLLLINFRFNSDYKKSEQL